MGLSERKEKQRISYDPRNLSWSDDKDRFSYKHMKALGWTDASGIGGAALTGNAKHIAVVHKLDSSGIGMARAVKEGDAVGGQARAGLEDVLKRLASASASASPSPAPEDVKPLSRNRIASRHRHLQSKRLASSSPAALAEILGISPSAMPKLEDIKPTAAELSLPSSSSLPDVKPTAAELDAKPVREAEDMVSTSTLSVSDYFRQKMRAKAIARQIAAGETPDLEPEVPIASSSKPTSTWTGTRMAFEADNTPLSFSDAPVSQDALGVPLDDETARKAAKAARKAEKEAKRAAKAERKKAKGEEGGVSQDGAEVKKRKREAE